jgi:XapX domain-containing protein
MSRYLQSPGVGIGAGVIQGPVAARSSAPRIIALLGSLGLFARSAAAQSVRAHGDAFAHGLKPLPVTRRPETGRSGPPPRFNT